MSKCLFSKLLLTGLLTLGLAATSPAQADSSDWLQVKRFKEVMSQAEQGKVQAMYEVGRKYERGRGTERNMQKAAEWYAKAAEANHAPAKARLGTLYIEGNGVKRDLKTAVNLLTEAANENIPSAQYQLGNMYELGTGVNQDLERAISWYRRADKGGYYRAGDKVKELTAELNTRSEPSRQPQPAAASTPAPASQQAATPSRSRGVSTVAAVMEGNWQRRGQPAGYLPSTISQCRPQHGVIKCISTAQQRSTGTETITYNTEATLTNFNDNQFEITYSNNILEVEKEKDAVALGFDEEEADSSGTSRIASSKKSKSHKLECTLIKPESIECTKDRLRKVLFSSL